MHFTKALRLAVGLAFAASLANASVVFTNLTGPAVGGNQIQGSAVTTTGGPESLAEAFTPSANFSLTDAEAFLTTGPTGGGTVNFSIYSSVSNFPGTSLDTLGSVTIGSGIASTLYTENTLGNPLTLLSGVQYWLVLTPGTSTTKAQWSGSGSSSVEAITSDPTGTSGWVTPGAIAQALQFQIDGTATSSVPEPGTIALFGVGLGALAVYRRRRA